MVSKKDLVGKNGFLLPNHKPLKVDGKVAYSEADQCWNLLRLKREILQEFPQLKEKLGNFGYTMIIPRSHEAVKEALDEMRKEAIPILLFLNRYRKED